MQIAVRLNGLECALVEEFMAVGGCIPLLGFGSSDCRVCPAHLLMLSPAFDLRRIDAICVV